MRLIAIVPALLSAAAAVLSFLCLFAGSSRHFMQDYAILTLNTSRIGENLLNASHHSSNPFLSIIDNITDSIEHDLDNDINNLARALGLRDWYSAHILDYCEGYYEPSPVANATVPASSIHENATYCSNTTALYHFDPQKTLQQQLKAGKYPDLDLADLAWPKEISNGLHDLHAAQTAVFVLYCLAIASATVAFALALVGVFVLQGRVGALANAVVAGLAFLAIGLASAVVTAVAVDAARLVNRYGDDVGVRASRGDAFLALTWVATAAMLLAAIVWCFECVLGNRSRHGRVAQDSKSVY